MTLRELLNKELPALMHEFDARGTGSDVYVPTNLNAQFSLLVTLYMGIERQTTVQIHVTFEPVRAKIAVRVN